MQRRPVRIVGRIGSCGPRQRTRRWLLLFGARTQRGLVLGSCCLQLVAVFDPVQPRLHGIELGSGDDVLIARRQHVADLLLDSFYALGSRRMRREKLGHRPGCRFSSASTFSKKVTKAFGS